MNAGHHCYLTSHHVSYTSETVKRSGDECEFSMFVLFPIFSTLCSLLHLLDSKTGTNILGFILVLTRQNFPAQDGRRELTTAHLCIIMIRSNC